ncbi:acyl-CoA dehydrogenase [Cohnella endophytica]|uniref:Acyl-CoA dehydrogenase n=1 Tax=Cohnella endophytica TaxID=2419778 RepID=A0A494XBS8_9BACL|nr:acyl-CoA dehydrogenase family protein [Cohnella endophytica]RKP47978.1 acyl-CoA dehydrogenase [Cohnella endophytica]
MSTLIPSDLFIRNDREAAIAARAERLAASFALRAPEHDRDRSFPFANFADMKDAGYLTLTLPREYGGEEASLYEMVLSQERLARGDGSTALAVGWHLGQLMQLRLSRPWPERLFAKLCEEVVQDGALINNFSSERATGSPTRGGKPETKAVRADGGWLISGRKSYSTLSPIVRFFTLTASIEGSDTVGEFLVRQGPGVTVEETWDTLGMRATGSHDVLLERVFVPDEDTIFATGMPPKTKLPDEAGVLLHIPACYIGIAHAGRDFALRFALDHKPNSIGKPIAELPHIERQIGMMESELISARSFLYFVADRWDRQPEQREALKPELGLAKLLATNAAIRILDQAMRIVGGASLSKTLPLERMYRDVRAGLHNPPMDDAVIQMLALRALHERAVDLQ